MDTPGAVFLACAVTVIGCLWYIRCLVFGTIRPPIAPWIVFSTTLGIGFWSYWHSPNHSLEGNIGNLTGLVSAGVNFVAILVEAACRRRLFVKFNRFQIWCLIVAGEILMLWFGLRFMIGGPAAAMVSNILTQVLMIVGYVALIERLYRMDDNNDSFITWLTVFAASVLSLVPAVDKHDLLGLLYSGRAVISSFIVVCLIVRIFIRAQKTQNASASA